MIPLWEVRVKDNRRLSRAKQAYKVPRTSYLAAGLAGRHRCSRSAVQGKLLQLGNHMAAKQQVNCALTVCLSALHKI